MAISRICLLAFASGVGAVHLLPLPPPAALLGGVSVLLLGVAGGWRWYERRGVSGPHMKRAAPLLWLALAAVAGLAYGSARVEARLADALDASNEDKVTRVVLRVAELPRLEPDSRIFVADVLSSIPEGVPGRIQVRWNSGDYAGPYGRRAEQGAASRFPELLPGQVWRMALI
ncbi:MAG: DUF4131 domain-containing protein, partial [Alcaligenaceae bacterium]|nr:DUF4131 domain-containing protein [Alcaligenaceae bacterium]